MERVARSVRLAAAAAALAMMSPAVAGAQGQPAQQGQPPTYKEQVEVVATKVPETPQEVPAAIEVISGDQLAATGATTLREALSLAAGVDVAPGGDGGPAASVPEFWGLREFDAFLLVVDGIPWGGAFNPSLATLSLRDVERIEVLRGPAPVTYGATSFVGVIYVVHKSGAAAGRYATASVGSYGSGSAGLDLALPAFGSWQTRLSVDGERRGYSDDRTSYARGHASYRGSTGKTGDRMWFMADVDVLRQDPASPHPREGAALTTAVPTDANQNPAGAFVNEARVTGMFGSERTLGGGLVWTWTGSFSHSSQQQFRGFLTDVGDTADNATGYRENIDVNDVYADTHVAWPARSHVRLVAGGDFLFGNGEAAGATFAYTAPLDGATATVVPEPADLNLDAEARRSFFGAYAMAEYTPVPRLTLSAGARLNATVERHGEGDSVSHARLSGSAGAIYGLWERGVDHVRAYASYRNTFKPAAFDFSLAENEGVLAPETAQSYEGGIKARAARGRVDVEASVFRMNFENLVTSTVVDGLPSLVNAGKTRFQGVETAAAFHGPHHVSGRATYSFHDSTFVDVVQAFDGVPQQLAGKRFEMSPRHLFSAGLIVAPERGVVGSLIVKYTGDRYLDKRNRALAAPFATVDAGLGYRLGAWEVRLDGRNLTDRRDPVSESEVGDAQYYLMTARRVDLTAGVRF